MPAKRLIVTGRVQAVGFRMWMEQEARRVGVSGWVRNRADGSIEAVIAGDAAAVEEMMRACRRGPRLARVDRIEEELVDPPPEPGFRVLFDAG
ncbi:MAG: acylphosphatase [Acetobacteraceae bacterium]|nr:acylphosphatase [Acetobacteraceae bacterium]